MAFYGLPFTCPFRLHTGKNTLQSSHINKQFTNSSLFSFDVLVMIATERGNKIRQECSVQVAYYEKTLTDFQL
jgi:hypothetical protein